MTGETTFLIDRQLTKTWDAFVEYAGDFAEQGGPTASGCISARPTSRRPISNWICMWEWVCLARRWIISSESAIRFAFSWSGASLPGLDYK